MESISSGEIRKSTVLLTLSLGVGCAIGLSAIRALYNFSVMYYLIPCYGISLVLMFACPSIFTAMAFDSGGTASGPMSTSFVLPMIIGIVSIVGGENPNYYETGFGVVAGRFAAVSSLGFARNLRRRLFGKVQDFSFANIDKFENDILSAMDPKNYIGASINIVVYTLF